YFFAGNEQKEMFLKEPGRYAPVLSGADLVSFVDRKKREPGKHEHGVFYNDRVYLFISEESLGKFQANSKHYLDKLSPSKDAPQPDKSDDLNVIAGSMLLSRIQMTAYKSFVTVLLRRLTKPIAPSFNSWP